MSLLVSSLSPDTTARLKLHAEPLVDTWDSVINRALDALDASVGSNPHPQPETSIRAFNPAAPPSLSYTTVKSVTLGERRFTPQDTKWNVILAEAAREAKKKMSAEKVKNIMGVNCVLGKKEDHGYKFFEDLGMSIQGQDANGAWKGIYNILTAIKMPIDLMFVWQDNPKAAFPSTSGRLAINALSSAD